jgi:hypothetical protein
LRFGRVTGEAGKLTKTHPVPYVPDYHAAALDLRYRDSMRVARFVYHSAFASRPAVVEIQSSSVPC